MTLASQSAEQETHVTEGVTGVAGKSPSQIAWGRLKRDKVGMTSLIVVMLYVVIALLAPVITKALGVDIQQHTELIGDGGMPKVPGIANSGISGDHLLGIEPLTGRDILAELLYGARISLLVAFLGTILTVVLGILVGIIAGYSGGRTDAFLGRLMDMILAFPQLLLLLALSPVVTQVLDERFGIEGNAGKVTFLIVVFGIFGWPYLARIVRGQVLSLREREFVEAAISIGARTSRILFREVLPNLWVPIIVYATLLLPSYIAAEAALSFLGVGVSEPTPTWGAMLTNSVKFSSVDPLYLFIPGTALFVLVLAFNLLGDSVRDALDPRAGRA